MQINLEASDRHAIQAYDEDKIQINSNTYQRSLIVSRQEIITDLTIKNIADMDESFLKQIINLHPEVVLIGHHHLGAFPPIELINSLANQRIGLECMSIGAACRTFNVLLSEGREVVGVFIL